MVNFQLCYRVLHGFGIIRYESEHFIYSQPKTLQPKYLDLNQIKNTNLEKINESSDAITKKVNNSISKISVLSFM